MEGAPNNSEVELSRSQLIEFVKPIANDLIKPQEGEHLNPESYAIIAKKVTEESQRMGIPLTKGNVEKILRGSDALINATIVRMDTDTSNPHSHLVDSNLSIIGKTDTKKEMVDKAREEREAK